MTSTTVYAPTVCAVLTYAAPVACLIIAALALGYYEFRAAHKRNGGNE